MFCAEVNLKQRFIRSNCHKILYYLTSFSIIINSFDQKCIFAEVDLKKIEQNLKLNKITVKNVSCRKCSEAQV